MIEEFKKFALRGSAVDLAIGVIIGAAFGIGFVLGPAVGGVLGGVIWALYTYVIAPQQERMIAAAVAEALAACPPALRASLEAAADGSIDNRERMILRDAITAERQNLDRIERMLGSDDSEAVN